MHRNPLPLVLATLGIAAFPASAQRSNNPFAPPAAKLQYAPDRDFDLQHLKVFLDIDWPNRKFTGASLNTVAPLRAGLTQLRFHAGKNLVVKTADSAGNTWPSFAKTSAVSSRSGE